MGQNLDKSFNIFLKMKFSAALLATVAVAEKKVPPRHPLQRLNKLTMFSEELMNDWFGALPSKDNWIAKFATNAGRMARNFERGNQRCGFYDENQMPHGGPEEEESNDNADDGYDNDDGYRRRRFAIRHQRSLRRNQADHHRILQVGRPLHRKLLGTEKQQVPGQQNGQMEQQTPRIPRMPISHARIPSNLSVTS